MRSAELYGALTVAETCFNLASCVPYVSDNTSGLRAALGTMEAIAGIWMLVFGVTSNNRTLRELSGVGSELLIHGVLNFARGCWELGASWKVNIPFVVASRIYKGHFGPVIAYGDGYNTLSALSKKV